MNAYAKINWMLRVTNKRADGFHDLETIFQTISLHDTLTFTPADRFALTCSERTIPTDERNLVARAARALGVDRVAIHIEKRIPAGGGLGGGSSNAASSSSLSSRSSCVSTWAGEVAHSRRLHCSTACEPPFLRPNT